jgi:hypothetical protein
MIIQILLAAIAIFSAIAFNCTGQGKTEFSWSNLPNILGTSFQKRHDQVNDSEYADFDWFGVKAFQ